ncbi:GFA family protein [Kordiimonas aquimaris]|uniref:GFA family protein n=1 Tax=Kordiimonas aquimaris TaxID=707591 RepID=UPI0021D1EA51|nr:GFA family protein [Kordiimonas aquimaris]
MAAPNLHKGHCLCGNVSIEASGEPRWAGHCHCPSCQKAVGAAFATYAGFLAETVRINGDTLKTFRSSPGVTRRFCSNCGSAVSFEGEAWPGEIHLHLVLLDDAGMFEPQGHVYVKTQQPWLNLDDNLPKRMKLAKDD